MISRNFYNYFFIAAFASLIDLGLLYFLTDVVGIFYLISATFSFVGAQVVNYLVNKKLNFNNPSRKIVKQLIFFIFVNTIGLGISLVILAFLVEVFGIWYILAKIISMLVAFNSNYYFHKKYTFSERIF